MRHYQSMIRLQEELAYRQQELAESPFINCDDINDIKIDNQIYGLPREILVSMPEVKNRDLNSFL